MSKIKHEWGSFCNPRNKRVKVTACVQCGVAKGSIAAMVKCSSKDDSLHHMKKMGWLEQQTSI